MRWKVFNFNDHSTWPELNCPLLVFFTNNDWPCILQWDKEGHCFVDEHRSYYPTQCFYKYIGYMPYIERECHPIKCVIKEGVCDYEDDGYCLNEKKCKHQYKTKEYALGSKPIWKEY